MLTVMDVRRVQSFPDEEVLVGNAYQGFRIVGNSVDRRVALSWGMAIREAWWGKKPAEGNWEDQGWVREFERGVEAYRRVDEVEGGSKMQGIVIEDDEVDVGDPGNMKPEVEDKQARPKVPAAPLARPEALASPLPRNVIVLDPESEDELSRPEASVTPLSRPKASATVLSLSPLRHRSSKRRRIVDSEDEAEEQVVVNERAAARVVEVESRAKPSSSGGVAAWAAAAESRARPSSSGAAAARATETESRARPCSSESAAAWGAATCGATIRGLAAWTMAAEARVRPSSSGGAAAWAAAAEARSRPRSSGGAVAWGAVRKIAAASRSSPSSAWGAATWERATESRRKLVPRRASFSDAAPAMEVQKGRRFSLGASFPAPAPPRREEEEEDELVVLGKSIYEVVDFVDSDDNVAGVSAGPAGSDVSPGGEGYVREVAMLDV